MDKICILARYPRLGEVKTRLTPPLSAEEALALHEALVRQAVRSARALAATGEARVELRTDAAFPRAAGEWLGERDVTCRYQGDGDHGLRIEAAFAEAFGRGAERVVVIGSDCPRLSSAHLRDAFRRLADADVVLGPAGDGDYYLVALRRQSAKRAVPALFASVAWGVKSALTSTRELAEKAELRWDMLETLPSVHAPEDVADARVALARAQVTPDARVSVVIPAFDDAGLVGAAVKSTLDAGAAEVLVVDGGSRDATRATARAAGARVIETAPGRARQMNAGAAEAIGDVLLFLHADTVPPPDACALARAALASPRIVAGAFSFALPDDARHAVLVSAVRRARSRLGGAPWEDQALFIARDTFLGLGGLPELPAVADFEFMHRLRRLGRVVTLPESAVTSARTWDEHGLIFPIAVNATAIAAYKLGVDPERIARWRQRIARSAATSEGAPDVS